MGHNKAQQRILAVKPTWVRYCYRCKEWINKYVPRDVPTIKCPKCFKIYKVWHPRIY